jgi:hypothetical protein
MLGCVVMNLTLFVGQLTRESTWGSLSPVFCCSDRLSGARGISEVVSIGSWVVGSQFLLHNGQVAIELYGCLLTDSPYMVRYDRYAYQAAAELLQSHFGSGQSAPPPRREDNSALCPA